MVKSGKRGFKYVLSGKTLQRNVAHMQVLFVERSAIHSLFGYSLLSVFNVFGAFEAKSIDRPTIIKQAGIWGLSVSFDLLSLKYGRASALHK
jgi:hypothetical protein